MIKLLATNCRPGAKQAQIFCTNILRFWNTRLISMVSGQWLVVILIVSFWLCHCELLEVKMSESSQPIRGQKCRNVTNERMSQGKIVLGALNIIVITSGTYMYTSPPKYAVLYYTLSHCHKQFPTTLLPVCRDVWSLEFRWELTN